MLPAADPYCIIVACSGNEDDQCPICLQTMVGPTVFPADGCEHVYCVECLCALQAHAGSQTRLMACPQCRRQARLPVAARVREAARNACEFIFLFPGHAQFIFASATVLSWLWTAVAGFLFVAVWVAIEVGSRELWRISAGLWRTSTARSKTSSLPLMSRRSSGSDTFSNARGGAPLIASTPQTLTPDMRYATAAELLPV
jgi:hypothetical protein